MARPIKVVTADKGVRAELERRAKAPTSAHRDRLRTKIVVARRLEERGCGGAGWHLGADGVDMVEPL